MISRLPDFIADSVLSDRQPAAAIVGGTGYRLPMQADQAESIMHAYSGRPVALLTQHGKEQVLAQPLERALGCRVQLVTGYDTDQLGSFTREIPRAGTQLGAARKKARIGMERSGLSLGLASEGSYAPDPFSGLFPWNTEILVWFDDERELEVIGVAQGKANFAHLLAPEWAAVEAFAKQVRFPEQHLVLRPDGEQDLRICKGIGRWEDLHTAFFCALADSANGLVFVETDGRAHANPARMEIIRRAGEDLARKLCSCCPVCATPGFWIVERVVGLPCQACGAPTGEVLCEVHGCLKCAYRIDHLRHGPPYADPGRCAYCNP